MLLCTLQDGVYRHCSFGRDAHLSIGGAGLLGGEQKTRRNFGLPKPQEVSMDTCSSLGSLIQPLRGGEMHSVDQYAKGKSYLAVGHGNLLTSTPIASLNNMHCSLFHLEVAFSNLAILSSSPTFSTCPLHEGFLGLYHSVVWSSSTSTSSWVRKVTCIGRPRTGHTRSTVWDM